MNDRKNKMKNIFDKLSEKNKDILILVAKSMKIAREEDKRVCSSIK